MNCKYIIITPVRDEIEGIQLTLLSVILQTVLPERWIIIDDGSTDGTRDVLNRFSEKYPWIVVYDYIDKSDRAVGKRITEIIHEGLKYTEDLNWDFWVKLDADISFRPSYFEILLKHFEKNPRLGMSSGKSYVPDGLGSYTLEWSPDHFVLGMARMYRQACWQDIGALAPRRLWDVIDVFTAQMNHWETRSFNELSVIHLRPIDALQHNQLQRRFDSGIQYYTVGYYPLYFALRCLRAAFDEKPFIFSGMMMAFGFFYGWLSRKPIYDEELKKFIRSEQKKKLSGESLGQYLSRRGRTLS